MHGQIRPKRIFVSLGTNDWTVAEMEFARLYERGLLPPVEVGASMLDPDAITVPQAGKRYLESRTGASLDPIEKDTLDHYASLIEQRLFPYCELTESISFEILKIGMCAAGLPSRGDSSGGGSASSLQ